jgi:hypothetical protein
MVEVTAALTRVSLGALNLLQKNGFVLAKRGVIPIGSQAGAAHYSMLIVL